MCVHLATKTTHHILGQLLAGQILDVLVLRVDDLRELLALDHLLEDPHPNRRIELLLERLRRRAHDTRDR